MEPDVEQQKLEHILSRMSSSLSLDLSNSIPEKDQDGFGQIDKKPLKIIPIDKEGTLSKLFIHSSHVLNSAEQILLEYLDQPKSTSATKCTKVMQVNYNFSILSLQRLLEILEKRHREHHRDNQCRASFNLQVDPLKWGPDKIFFQTCDDLDELILVVRFILKHNLEVSGRLVATFYK